MMKRSLFAWSAAAALGAVLAAGPVFSKDAAPAGLEAQMRKVLENQDHILAALEEIKKELKIIKVRATR